VPKRGDFFHLKVFRRPEDVEEPTKTVVGKYKEVIADKSTTFKFAPGSSA